MFYIQKDAELTIPLLNKMINKFNLEVRPKLNKYKNYYDGVQKILSKTYTDETKPCNRVVVNYCKNIADSYCGYLAAPSYISYSSEQDIESIMDILRYNDYQAEDSDFLLNALVYGKACELMFTDEQAKVRFKQIDPMQCFGVYDDSLTGDLLYFVRIYPIDEWDGTENYNVDVYTDKEIRHYRMIGHSNILEVSGEPSEFHYFNQCPANIFMLPDEKSIFDCILTLQDASNELLSSEIDDFSAFCDAYLALVGADADSEQITSMKEDRVLLLPEGSNASWLTKNVSDTQIENMLKRVQDSIYRIAACPDFSSESFVGGVSSGIAIQYRLTGMETRASKIEAEMKKALQRRIEIICGIASLKLGEEIFRDIDISFKRNVPEDYTSTIAVVNSLKGIVSDKTLLGLLPFVDDVNAEIEAVNEQKQENMSLYGFPTPSNDNTDNTDNTDDEE